jgi:uncharacterized phage protein (TIGR01671 family)
MRELKFRSYEEETKKIVMVDGWKVKDGILKCDSSPVMQYTGLKDKNGKEIWEGDITEFRVRDNDGSLIREAGVIVWGEKTGCWHKKTIRYSEVLVENESELYKKGSYKTGRVKYETVVGNIYENPELFKELFK